ncbi:MAG: threonine synthase [Bacillota bacterium]
MYYYSTREGKTLVNSAEVIKKGLAPDGGLFVPANTVTPFSINNLPGGSYKDIARTIFELYLTDFEPENLGKAVSAAYNIDNFDHEDITPLKKMSDELYFLELWHGPTYAFKDIALQILPHFLRNAVRITDEKSEVVILTATSGDTGKSALEGFSNVPETHIIVYYPENGVSEIQQLQMTTQEGHNLGVAAVKGNFDDAQSGVKALFNDHKLAEKLAESGYRLTSANSINWGRLLPQIIYYFKTYDDLVQGQEIQTGDRINFVVPTGNFGNILAGYYARQLGLPINRLICAANRNNVLSDFIRTGNYNSRRPLHKTYSPSMDILISSNLERLLFELTGHNIGTINYWMNKLQSTGEYSLDSTTLNRLQKIFWADYANDRETLETIEDIYKHYNYLVDTHTAVGKAVLQKYLKAEKDHTPTVILSTASPFKFCGSVIKALFGENRYRGKSELELLEILSRETGNPIPANLADLAEKPVKHKQVIERENLYDHLLKVLSLH